MELSKSQKKIARMLIEEAMQRECKAFMESVEQFVQQPERENETFHNKYIALYKKVHSFDKHFGKRYDGLGGSYYFITVVDLFYSNVLTIEDISQFDEEVQNQIMALKALYEQ